MTQLNEALAVELSTRAAYQRLQRRYDRGEDVVVALTLADIAWIRAKAAVAALHETRKPA